MTDIFVYEKVICTSDAVSVECLPCAAAAVAPGVDTAASSTLTAHTAP